jgi:hypothetical protein
MQEATTFSIFYDGLSFQHLATELISVFTLCYGPGLVFRGPRCIGNSTTFFFLNYPFCVKEWDLVLNELYIYGLLMPKHVVQLILKNYEIEFD